MSDLVFQLAESIAKPFESCRLVSYWDPVGYPTNGWGNLLVRKTKASLMKELNISSIQADEWLQKVWPPISQLQADDDLHQNMTKHYNAVKRLVKVKITENQAAALLDFSFNLGPGNLQISTLLRMINRGDTIQAADEFPKWNKAAGVVLRGLTKRRIVERNVFLQ